MKISFVKNAILHARVGLKTQSAAAILFSYDSIAACKTFCFASIVSSALFFSAPALAGTSDEMMPFFRGARMLSMGGAQVAVSNDETALLSNPAGLGRVRDYYGTILDPEIDVNQNFSTIYKTKSVGNPFGLQAVADSLALSPDKYYYARAQVFPSFVVRNFGIGIYWRQVMAAYMNAAGTAMDVRNYDDMSLLLGYNLRLWEGRIKIGVTGKAISRIEINKSVDPTSNLDRATNSNEGVGFGLDAGLILAAPWTFIPTIAAVVRDVGGTKFEGGKNIRLTTTGTPAPLTQDYDVGVALFPIQANRVRSTLTVEYQKVVASATAVDKTRHFHAGWELNIYDTVFLRAGLNQRYPTGGLEIATEHTQLQLTTYSEDVGIDGSPVEDRRYVFKFAIRF